MITTENFEKYEPIVLEAIDELFNHCINKEVRPNEFLIFLENGHFDDTYSGKGFSPYLIGQGMEGAKDGDRMSFVELYLKLPFEKNYNETEHPQQKFDIRRQSTALSMMVYTHFWESKVFLRKLKQLAMLLQGNEYDWNLVVRPKETYTFIKDEIREVFNKEGLKIYDIIKQTYRSQIRNAFAHSDYYLSDNKVYLDNYDSSNKWSIEYVDYDEFDKIIILTLLIHHAMVSKIDEYRKILGEANPDREIYIPEKSGVIRKLHYRQTGPIHRWLWPNQIQK